MNILRYVLCSPNHPPKNDPLTALAIGSSVVNGIGSLISGNSANEMNMRLARENREWQSQENQLNREWQESMWNKQNEYNTPANQRKLAVEGGYNPYLLSSQNLGSGAGSAGTPSMVSTPNQAHVNPVNPLGAVSDTVTSLLPMIQQQQQIEANVEEQHAKTLETVYRTAFDAYSKGGPDAYNKVMQSMAPMLDRIEWNGSFLEKQLHESIRGMQLDNTRKELENEFKEIENNWSNQLFADKHLLNSDQHKMFLATLDKVKAEIKEILSRSDLNKVEKERIIQEKIGITIENGLKGFDYENKRDLQEEIQEMTLEQLWKMEDERNYMPFDKDYQYQGKVGEYFPLPSGQFGASEQFKRNEQRNSYKRGRRFKKSVKK